MSKIKKKSEITLPQKVVGCIVGTPGIGKTTLALSAPKPLLLDCDNGIHRVQAEYRTDCVQVESYEDILDVLQEDLSDYETIVIDTLGKLIEFMLDYFFNKDCELDTLYFYLTKIILIFSQKTRQIFLINLSCSFSLFRYSFDSAFS